MSLTGVVESVDGDGALVEGARADGTPFVWAMPDACAGGFGFFTGRLRCRSQIPTASTMNSRTMAVRSSAGAIRRMRPGFGTHGDVG